MKVVRLMLFFSATMFLCSLAYTRAARATEPPETSSVCETENVAGLGGFNAEADCPSGTSATGGGYELVSPDFSQLLGASVNESMPTFLGTAPHGWEVVGSNNTTIAGKIRVCVLCTNND